MVNVLARNWALVAVRGVIALLFGVFAIARPDVTLSALVILFGAFALVDGLVAVWSALFHRRGEPHWVALLLGGITGIVIGIGTFAMPAITAVALLYLIAAWAIVRGVVEITMAIQLRKVVTGEWLLALAGVLSVLFGVFLVAYPAAGALAVMLWIGVWAIVVGVVVLALAFRLRKWSETMGARTPAPA
ncbi:MAG TPA: DUF308 domain-containing protein [Gemmatimonadaceae bacterium]|jgi:uncharacterized membrane protein HdeD (DUF308 family)|nr:DUF308 domain-containing protein [Gemmatimonadaceae bacterium]